MKEGLQPLPNAAAASDAAVVVCMKSCGFPEERSDEEGDEDDEEEGEGEIKLVDASKKMTAGESRKVVARLERAAARIERRPEDEQVAQLAAFKVSAPSSSSSVLLLLLLLLHCPRVCGCSCAVLAQRVRLLRLRRV